MKKLTFILLIIALSFGASKAQSNTFCNLDSMKEINGKKVYDMVEEMPSFPGGDQAFHS